MKLVIAVFLICFILTWEYGRGHGLGQSYSVSYEALLRASTVSSENEWKQTKYFYRKEWLSGGGCDKLTVVDNFQDFIGNSFPGCEDNPGWGGFVVYPEKQLARFNFPFLGNSLFLEKIYWADLDFSAYNLFYSQQQYFPVSEIIAHYGYGITVKNSTELLAIIEDPNTRKDGNLRFSELNFKNNMPNIESTATTVSDSGGTK